MWMNFIAISNSMQSNVHSQEFSSVKQCQTVDQQGHSSKVKVNYQLVDHSYLCA